MTGVCQPIAFSLADVNALGGRNAESLGCMNEGADRVGLALGKGIATYPADSARIVSNGACPNNFHARVHHRRGAASWPDYFILAPNIFSFPEQRRPSFAL